ncbi:MAG: DUF1549 domain-containing protein, partial [Thermoguttaceae bacterium]|nr:DUF1549 domain-containing protein [Thermoguttaceae bacterium]
MKVHGVLSSSKAAEALRISRVSVLCFLAAFAFFMSYGGQGVAQPTGKNPVSARALVTPSAVKPKEVDPKQFWKFFETDQKTVVKNGIDKIVFAELKKHNMEPAPLCSDSVFIRRVYFDLIGYPPSFMDTYNFLRDQDKGKRAKLIDSLLEKVDYSDYWTMKWCDFLRVKAEFPINLWPVGAMVYYRWVHESLRTSKPYDVMAR